MKYKKYNIRKDSQGMLRLHASNRLGHGAKLNCLNVYRDSMENSFDVFVPENLASVNDIEKYLVEQYKSREEIKQEQLIIDEQIALGIQLKDIRKNQSNNFASHKRCQFLGKTALCVVVIAAAIGIAVATGVINVNTLANSKLEIAFNPQPIYNGINFLNSIDYATMGNNLYTAMHSCKILAYNYSASALQFSYNGLNFIASQAYNFASNISPISMNNGKLIIDFSAIINAGTSFAHMIANATREVVKYM